MPPPPGAMPPPTPSSVPKPQPSPTFHDLPSRLPPGIQMLDGASRNMAKALGTLEFIENPPERAALLAIKQDTDNLITRMTRKSVGAKPSAPMESEDEGAPDMEPEE